MRFRAKISNENLNLLHNITSHLQRSGIGDKMTVYLTRDHVRLAAISDDIDSTKCYSELSVDSLFTEYLLESRAENCILFEIGLDNLSKALQSGRHAIQCIFKLTKHEDKPYFSFESKSVDARALDVTHDIPIRMLQAADIVNYLPPNVPNPDVALELPKTKQLRPMVEKMGKYSKHVQLTALQSGQLILQVESSTILIKTHYTGLATRLEGNVELCDSRRNKATVKVDRKKLSNLVNYVNLIRAGVFLFVTDNSALVLHITLSPTDLGNITYYIPIVIMDFEDLAS